MKNITVASILTFGLLGLLTSCKKDDPQPETDRIKNVLKTTSWKIQSVSVSNTDQTSLFTGLTLSFTDTNYTTTNGGVVWPASGTWIFTDGTAKKILRSDDVEITLIEVTSTSLEFSLVWDTGTIGTGRTSSIAGTHVFTFIPG